jgi:site-specific recombinase XerD
MMDYEIKIEKNKKRNEKFIKEFEKWLIEKNMSEKTIRKHISNIDLYINNYLNYYDISTMEDGVFMTYSFLDGWFIEKCLWSSKNSIKTTASSIKKFYQCMSEYKYIKEEDYKQLCDELKNGMDDFLNSMDSYEDGTYYDIF